MEPTQEVNVEYLNFNPDAPAQGYWGMHMLSKMLESIAPNTVVSNCPELPGRFTDSEVAKSMDRSAIVVVPGEQNAEFVEQVNAHISRYVAVVLIITGDEQNLFPVHEIKHPNIRIWVMSPNVKIDYPPTVSHFLGFGFAPHMEELPAEAPIKLVDWFFAGQINNDERVACHKQLEKLQKEDMSYEICATAGFAQGFQPSDYVKKMAMSKVVPCPGGPCSPDTFRAYEALESGAIPILGAFAGNHKEKGYWRMVLGDDHPLEVIEDWDKLPDLVRYYHDVFPYRSNQVFAWWQMYKRNLRQALLEDYRSLGNPLNELKEALKITVIIPTSPIKSHPSTHILEQTIASVRHHLPNSEIIVTFDGIRPEQEYHREAYTEFTRQMLWKFNRQYTNIVPIVFDEPMHQVAMAREALKHVRTGKILYVEHDTPLVTDLPIDWMACGAMISTGRADLIRFHFEAVIPEEHKHLMLDPEPVELYGQHWLRTIQWSQRPHLASTAFYNRILADHFSPYARTFIEDKMHGVVHEAYINEKSQGWNRYKLWIYAPEGNYKRSLNLDGREDDPKYDMTF
jgi:hypothetical protein